MLGATKDKKGPYLLDVVALLSDLSAQRLARGQVGTIVEQLDENVSLVEFSDEQGRAYAIVPCTGRLAYPPLRSRDGLTRTRR
jgi:hypothetical protein